MTPLDQSIDKFLGEGVKPAANVAGIHRAINITRDVYGSVPGAEQALRFLQAALAAGAEVREAAEWRERALKAEAALAGGANASIAEGTHTGAGEGLVAGAATDMLGSLKQFAGEVNAGAAAWAAPALSTVISTLVVKIDTSAIDAALAKVEELKAALASVMPAQTSGRAL